MAIAPGIAPLRMHSSPTSPGEDEPVKRPAKSVMVLKVSSWRKSGSGGVIPTVLMIDRCDARFPHPEVPGSAGPRRIWRSRTRCFILRGFAAAKHLRMRVRPAVSMSQFFEPLVLFLLSTIRLSLISGNIEPGRHPVITTLDLAPFLSPVIHPSAPEGTDPAAVAIPLSYGNRPVWNNSTPSPPWATGGPGGAKGRPVVLASEASVVTSPTRQPVKRVRRVFPSAP